MTTAAGFLLLLGVTTVAALLHAVVGRYRADVHAVVDRTGTGLGVRCVNVGLGVARAVRVAVSEPPGGLPPAQHDGIGDLRPSHDEAYVDLGPRTAGPVRLDISWYDETRDRRRHKTVEVRAARSSGERAPLVTPR